MPSIAHIYMERVQSNHAAFLSRMICIIFSSNSVNLAPLVTASHRANWSIESSVKRLGVQTSYHRRSLEDTLTITEGRDVSSGVLLVHGLPSDDLNNHVAHDAHLGGTAVVQLNIELAGLLLRVLDVSAEVPNTVVAVVLGSRHPGKLHKREEEEDLQKASSGDGADAVNAGGHIRELQVVGGGQVPIEHNVVVVDNGANNGSHGNAAVLALDGTTALERLRLGLKPAKGIKDTEGLSHTELELVDGEGGGGPARLGGGEGGGRADEEGGDGELHGD
mmetsp:Transcript_11059/g.23228  ORF Transcript_11059/g.23228 Transcript_11059/m.23228 type:complete len:277 (-) Transcript_11059:35-865(-)